MSTALEARRRWQALWAPVPAGVLAGIGLSLIGLGRIGYVVLAFAAVAAGATAFIEVVFLFRVPGARLAAAGGFLFATVAATLTCFVSVAILIHIAF